MGTVDLSWQNLGIRTANTKKIVDGMRYQFNFGFWNEFFPGTVRWLSLQRLSKSSHRLFTGPCDDGCVMNRFCTDPLKRQASCCAGTQCVLFESGLGRRHERDRWNSMKHRMKLQGEQ